jgi:twitching motility two-component system response regulator PilG
VQPQSRSNPETGALAGAAPQPPVVTSVPAPNNIFAADTGIDQSSESGYVHATSLDQKTVLVVDDSPTVRKLVSITLEKRGYRVVSAFDGVAAIKEIAAHNPSLILMDVNMPRLDGYQLCKLVKKHETTRDIPVLMLTGKDGMFDRLRGRLVGCAGSIAKPFSPEELLKFVEQNIVQTK